MHIFALYLFNTSDCNKICSDTCTSSPVKCLVRMSTSTPKNVNSLYVATAYTVAQVRWLISAAPERCHSYQYCPHYIRGRDSAVGIATRYGLDGSVIESRRGRDFPPPSKPALGSTQSPIQWVPGLSRGKRPRRGVDHPLPSSAKFEGRVELYISSTSGPSWPVLGWTLPLPLPHYIGVSEICVRNDIWRRECDVTCRGGYRWVGPDACTIFGALFKKKSTKLGMKVKEKTPGDKQVYNFRVYHPRCVCITREGSN